MTWLVLLLAAIAVLVWPSGRARPRLARSSLGDARAAPAQRPERRPRGDRWRRRPPPRDDVEIADLVALGLEAGLPVEAAIELALGVAPSPGARPGQRLPPLLVRTLGISAELGAPVAMSARIASDVLRDQARARERTRVLAAGPRASMHLLTALPVIGPGVVILLGLPPGEVYGGALGMGAVLVGLALTGLGWLVSRGILWRAARPSVVRRPRLVDPLPPP